MLVTYYVLTKLYYLHFHPLSSFPGPAKAASSTSWIYRVTDGGFPEEELERLHKKYRSFNKQIPSIHFSTLTRPQRQMLCESDPTSSI